MTSVRVIILDKELIKRKDKRKLKHTLDIAQTASTLIIKGRFNRRNYQAIELWMQPRSNVEEKILISKIKPTHEFEFKVSMENLIDLIKKTEDNIVNWYIKVTTPLNSLSEKRLQSNKYEQTIIEGESYASYFIRLGRFQYTTLNDLNFYIKDKITLTNYITTKGNFSTIIHAEPKSPIVNNVQTVEMIARGFHFTGTLNTGNSRVSQVQLLAKGRKFKQELCLTTSKLKFLDKDSKENYGLHHYKYNILVPLDSSFLDASKDDETYDLYFKFRSHDSVVN